MLQIFTKRGLNEETNSPKFSIANVFGLGDLPPCLQDVTISERRLKSLASFKGHAVVARGGKHKFIKSHILVFFFTAGHNKRRHLQNYG